MKRFSAALLAKLKLARENGRNGWEQPDWEDACQRGLLRHIEKGDPRDVAAYCAFMWHHGWITVAAQPPAAPVETVEAALRDAFPHFQDDAPITADAIRKLGNEWTEMVMGWSPVQREITFSDQDGNDRKLEWEVFENSAGWVIADSETWEVREPHPSPSADNVEVPTDALINLVNYQEQCDEDGVMVKVSRQALAEVLVYVQMTRPDLNGVPQAAPVTDNDLHYLKSIQRQLEVVKESLADTASFTLSGMAFADTVDWLDCFIDARERALAVSRPNRGSGE